MRITAAAYIAPPQPVPAAARPVGTAGVAAPTPPASPSRIAAVVRQLEVEADTLGHAGRATDAAAGVLDRVQALHRRDADATGVSDASGAGHALTRDARFDDRPLFDGRFSVHVGGGRLDLPDFTTAPPQPDAVGRARDLVAGFKRDVIDRRLGIVRQAIHHAADAAAVFLHDPTRATGRLLDVTA